MDTSSDLGSPSNRPDPEDSAPGADPGDAAAADPGDAASGTAPGSGRIVVIDTSGGIDRPAGPLGSRISGARQSDNSGRIEMPLAPKEPSKKLKRGDTGYRKAKKVKPIKAAKQGEGDEPAPRRSPALFVIIALLLVAAGSMLYIRESESVVSEDAMTLALDGKQFRATASFGIGLPAGSALTFSFTASVEGGGQLGISGGCNQIGGRFVLVDGFAATGTYGGTLQAPDGWTQTEMACDQPLMDLDAAVVELLSAEPRLSLVGATLTVTVTDGAAGPRSLTLDRVS